MEEQLQGSSFSNIYTILTGLQTGENNTRGRGRGGERKDWKATGTGVPLTGRWLTTLDCMAESIEWTDDQAKQTRPDA